MQKKVNILVQIPNAKDATSLYRGIGPFAHLLRNNDWINLNFVSEYSWVQFALCDLFFMQRPYSKAHLDMLVMAKDNNVPVWIDYDDDLFSVPVSNPAYPVYSNENTRKTIASMIVQADYVTTSTDFLKRQFERGPSPLNKNIMTIPNAFDERRMWYREIPKGERKRLIAWRGSTTHHEDISVHMEALVDLINSDSTWTWLFQGDKPWFLFKRLGNNAMFTESMDPIMYFKQLHEMKPSIMIVPLNDCDFNRSKSNIAWMEAAFFGAMTIAPDWEEWRKPGCINYKNQAEFKSILKAAMSGEFNPNEQAEKAWDYVQKNLMLSETNKKRIEIIHTLTKK